MLRTAWADAGRDPATLQVVPYAVVPTPGKLAHYAELGIEEVVLQLPPAGRPRCSRRSTSMPVMSRERVRLCDVTHLRTTPLS